MAAIVIIALGMNVIVVFMVEHRTAHNSENLFPCDQCTKSFSEVDNLKKHRKPIMEKKCFLVINFPCNFL